MEAIASLTYPLGREDMAVSSLKNLAEQYDLDFGNNISVNGSEVSDIIFGGDIDVQITSDTAVVTYTEPNLENFVQAVSMQGGTAYITNGVLNLNVPEVDLSGYVNSVSISGGNANISGNTLNLNIPATDLSGYVNSVSVQGGTGNISGNTLNLNIDTARQVINGATVSGANFVGNGIKSITYTGGVANVSIDTAEASNVTVNGYEAPKIQFGGGGAVVTYDSSNNQINVNIATNKSNPMLSVTSTYMLPNTTQTIEVGSDSDGIISVIPNDNVTARQVSANQFEISASQVGNYQLGIMQEATEDYYGMAKNALISVVDTLPDTLFMNFDNKQNLYINSGSSSIVVVTPEVDSDTAVSLSAGTLGDYNSAWAADNEKYLYSNLQIGESPFTIEFWTKCIGTGSTSDSFSISPLEFYVGDTKLGGVQGRWFSANAYLELKEAVTTDRYDFQYNPKHLALAYDGTTLRLFYDGTMLLNWNGEIVRDLFKLKLYRFNVYTFNIAQLQVIDGVCKYTSNFTPVA